jgi:hypothetical protein
VVSRCRGVQDISNSALASFVKDTTVVGPASEKSVRPRLEALSTSAGCNDLPIEKARCFFGRLRNPPDDIADLLSSD